MFTLFLFCSIKHAETFLGFTLNSVICLSFFFFKCNLGCSSCDYLETWALCLCMFVSVFPLTLHCAAAGLGTVPVDQVSLCLCLLLWLAWQKPINTTLPTLSLLLRLTFQEKKRREDYSCSAEAHINFFPLLFFYCLIFFLLGWNSLHTW